MCFVGRIDIISLLSSNRTKFYLKYCHLKHLYVSNINLLSAELISKLWRHWAIIFKTKMYLK